MSGRWAWVAAVSTAISGSAVFRAIIDEITSRTDNPATVSSQRRPRGDKAATSASISWSDGVLVSVMDSLSPGFRD